ncbi:MAG: hypothetical protein INR73_05925 [Williamsia sp.]|nr:hypothetical protein [Williamsia sp.]
MKSATAYYLLLIYLAASCKPLTIWVSDLMAHAFFEQEHLTTMHHQQGKDHVHYQIAKTAGEDGQEKSTPLVKMTDDIYLPVQYRFPLYNHVGGINYNGFHSINLPFITLSIQLPPPKA